jgi:hypothetical protein
MNGAKWGRKKAKACTRDHQSRHSSLSSRCARVSMVLFASTGAPHALSAPAASPQSWCRSPSIACRIPSDEVQHSRRACIACHRQGRRVEKQRFARRTGIDTSLRASPPAAKWEEKERTSNMLPSCCCASVSTQKSPSHAVPPPRPSASSSSSSADDARQSII